MNKCKCGHNYELHKKETQFTAPYCSGFPGWCNCREFEEEKKECQHLKRQIDEVIPGSGSTFNTHCIDCDEKIHERHYQFYKTCEMIIDEKGKVLKNRYGKTYEEPKYPIGETVRSIFGLPPLHEVCGNGYHVPEYVCTDPENKDFHFCIKCQIFYGKLIITDPFNLSTFTYKNNFEYINTDWMKRIRKTYNVKSIFDKKLQNKDEDYLLNSAITKLKQWSLMRACNTSYNEIEKCKDNLDYFIKKYCKVCEDKEKDNIITVYNATLQGISSTSFDKTKIRQELKPNWLIIKEWLLKYHGLYITNRQIGKTKALLEILKEDKNAILVTLKQNNVDNLKKRIRKEYDKQDDMELRVIKYNDYKQYYYSDNRKFYFDEYFYLGNELPANFAGAVSSMKFPVKIERFKSPIKNIFRDTYHGITNDEWEQEDKNYFQLEETLEFK